MANGSVIGEFQLARRKQEALQAKRRDKMADREIEGGKQTLEGLAEHLFLELSAQTQGEVR